MANIIELATLCGWRHYHTYNSRRSVSGFPDLVLVHPVLKRTIFWELKSEKGKVTQDQENWIYDLIRCGEDAAIMRPSDWPQIEQQLTAGLPSQQRLEAAGHGG